MAHLSNTSGSSRSKTRYRFSSPTHALRGMGSHRYGLRLQVCGLLQSGQYLPYRSKLGLPLRGKQKIFCGLVSEFTQRLKITTTISPILGPSARKVIRAPCARPPPGQVGTTTLQGTRLPDDLITALSRPGSTAHNPPTR